MNTLVICAIFATLASVVLCEMEKSQKFKDCMEETHTTDADLKAFFVNGMKPAEAKDNIKCNVKCVMEKNGHFKAGVFNEEAALKELKEVPQLKDNFAEVEVALRECKNSKGTNECDTAFQIFMCLKDHKLSPMSYM